MNALAVQVGATRDDVDRFAEVVEGFAREHALSSRVTMALSVALHEHLTNIVCHGGSEGGGAAIEVRLEIEGGRVVAEVRDTARPYDPLSAPEVDTAAPIEERPIGGLGVHFMRRLMDELSYRREGDRNVLRMAKAR